MKAWVLRKPGPLAGEMVSFNDAPLALKMLKESEINGAAAPSMA